MLAEMDGGLDHSIAGERPVPRPGSRTHRIYLALSFFKQLIAEAT